MKLDLGCVWDDESYGPDAPQILFDMISRNLPEGTEGSFVCFTDKPDDLGEWIEKRPLLADKDGITIFPLGCCVVRALDPMLKGRQVKCCFYDGEFPKEAQVVIFLDKKPSDCDGWPKHVWKIGGGTAAEMSYLSNVSMEILKANMISAATRACRWFEPDFNAKPEPALIVGGAPSLAYDLMIIRLMHAGGAKIFAINGALAYLASKGIIPDYHVILDAHPNCINFVHPEIPTTRYYASQCDRAVLDASGDSLVCWNGGGQAMEELGEAGITFRNLVGGGSTCASRAMVLAYGLGHRNLHLFGLDSSYEGDVGHVYGQANYSKHVNVTCGDQTFRTSPQLLGQAEDFKMVAPDLISAGCGIMVHGGGLLKALASKMAA